MTDEAPQAEVSPDAIADMLAGRRPYDDLTTKEQAVVRAECQVRHGYPAGGAHLGRRVCSAGEAYAELDENGAVVIRRPGDEPTRPGAEGRE